MVHDDWHTTEDLDAFLSRAGDFLHSRPDLHTVLLTVTDGLRTRGLHAYGGEAPFFGLLEEGGSVCGACFRTPPHRLYLTPLSAARAESLAAHWALTDLGLHRLELGHALGHDASCTVAERCGFRYEGTLRGAMFEAGRHDAFRDIHLHARLATDPEPA